MGEFLLGIYGGYFGGAVGIMMMAIWRVTTRTGLNRLQAPRTLLVTAANTAAIGIFAVMNAVRWHDVLLLAPSAIARGYLGALLGTHLPRRMVEAVTVILAGIVTVEFFAKAYF
ncbi:sulfite exporter TauE/SafE family protein [Novosphingobium barchaimii]|uniref:sulfite exporter TauE/SafE family protein n=1 Tax=Novosphingobium barchaimii TaxID=1420591 RepID=UPI000A89AEBB|nr:sulfite exporter TauE/SafE family protein [Novosphingobium barchaimii]